MPRERRNRDKLSAGVVDCGYCGLNPGVEVVHELSPDEVIKRNILVARHEDASRCFDMSEHVAEQLRELWHGVGWCRQRGLYAVRVEPRWVDGEPGFSEGDARAAG